MKKFLHLGVAAVTALALLGSAASAAVVLSDNFNSENGGNATLNDFSLSNWTVTSGSVDLIGVGSAWNFFPANGLYLDMNGSTGAAGTISSTASFGPGTYTLSFDFAGTQRNQDGSTVTGQQQGLDAMIAVTFGDAILAPITLAGNTGFTTQTFLLTTTAANSYLTFQSFNTGNAYIGGLLDNVVLTSVEGGPAGAEVPEPAALGLLGAGLLGLGLIRRRKRA